MKTLTKLMLLAPAVQIAYGLTNMLLAKNKEENKVQVDTLKISHEGNVYEIAVYHVDVLSMTTMPNAQADVRTSIFGGHVNSITIQSNLVGTDMYDAVLAHEIGHIVLGHLTHRKHIGTIARELEADAYAVSKGYIKGITKFRLNGLKYSGLLPDYNQVCLFKLVSQQVFN